MARRKTTLIDELEECANSIGGATAPDFGTIKGLLIRFIADARSLQAGADQSDLASENEALKAELEVLKVNQAAERSNSKVQMDVLRAELEALLKEKAKRDKKDPELPEQQFRILKVLPSEHSGGWLRVDEISRAVKSPIDEVEVHLARLDKAGFAVGRCNAGDALMWHRTMSCNE